MNVFEFYDFTLWFVMYKCSYVLNWLEVYLRVNVRTSNGNVISEVNVFLVFWSFKGLACSGDEFCFGLSYTWKGFSRFPCVSPGES